MGCGEDKSREKRMAVRRSKALREIKDKKLTAKLKHCYYTMKKRCYNKNSISYKDYGAKGITVCDEWLKNKDAFYLWSLANGVSIDKSLDRIDFTKGYSPENCRWTDVYTQANNKSNNVWIEYNGERHTIAQWARILGIDASTIYARYEKGNINPKRLLSKENLVKKRVVQIDKETGEIIAEYESSIAASRSVGFKYDNVYRACSGKKFSAGGYRWAFKGQENDLRERLDGQGRAVIRINPKTRERKVYASIASAVRENGGCFETITNHCCDKKEYRGYFWEFEEQ